MAKQLVTKMNTGKARFSYLTVITPKKAQNSDTEKYSVQLLIPKNDTETMKKMKQCFKNAIEVDKQNGNKLRGLVQIKTPWHDGDQPSPTGKSYGDAAKGCWVINVSTTNQPGLVDAQRTIDLNPSPLVWYSGIYGRANINFSAYNVNGNAGITAYLNHLQKLSDGPALSGAGAPDDAFDDGFMPDDDEDDLLI